MPAIQLAKVPDEVRGLFTSGLFYGASGVLTSVATYHPNLDFATIYNGYDDGLSTEDIQTLEESLLSHARLVAEQVSTQWVMDVHREDMTRSVRRGDIAQLADGTEPRLEVDIAPALTEPDVIPSGSEQHAPSPVIPTADAVEPPQ